MTYKTVVIVLAIVTATALGARAWLVVPPPPLTPSPTAAELEIAEAIRTCGVYGKPQEDRTSEIDGTVTLEECIQVNRKCQALWGDHSVWNGTARSDFDEAGNEQLIPNCKCDKSYEWLNADGTVGITMDDGRVFNIIDGHGKCVKQ